MAGKVSDVMMSTEGWSFHVYISNQPGRFITITFVTEAEAHAAKQQIVAALTNATEVYLAG